MQTLDRLIRAAHDYAAAHMAFIALSSQEIQSNPAEAVRLRSAKITARTELENAAIALDMEMTDAGQ